MTRLCRLLLVATLALTTACSAILRNPVPEQYHLDTTLLGDSDLRFWGDRREQVEHAIFRHAKEGTIEEHFSGIMRREHNYLAISGGGANGAYGAGVLCGWTAAGTRPVLSFIDFQSRPLSGIIASYWT